MKDDHQALFLLFTTMAFKVTSELLTVKWAGYYTKTTLITTYFNKSSFFNNQSEQFKQIQSLFCHDGHSINWCTLKNTSKKERQKFNNCVNFRDEN